MSASLLLSLSSYKSGPQLTLFYQLPYGLCNILLHCLWYGQNPLPMPQQVCCQGQLEVFIMPLWFLPEYGHSCGIQRNPVELFLAEPPAKITIPGTIYSGRIEPFRDWDWNGPGMDQNRIQRNAFCMYNKWSMHTPSGMFLSHRGVHRVLKMGCQWVSWVHGPRM